MFMDLKGGQRNPMLDAAQAISFTGGKDSREQELDAVRGEKVSDDWRDDPRLSMVTADPAKGVEASNPGGSFERLMAGAWSGSQGQALDTSAAAGGGG